MSGIPLKTPTIAGMFEGLDELPFRRHADALRNRANDLSHRLNAGAYYDQYPGKTVPWVFSKLYGPLTPQVPRTVPAAGGANEFAPLVTPARFVLPRGTNILTGRDAAFYWCSTNVATYVNFTYKSPGWIAGTPFTTLPNGDIFDRAIEDNGGAQMIMDNTNAIAANGFNAGSGIRVCFELDLYDKKRGRSLTDGRIPSEVITGLAYENKSTIWPLRFDVDTQIEPRVYITEINGNIGGTVVQFPLDQVTVFLNLAFFGYNQLEEKQVP